VHRTTPPKTQLTLGVRAFIIHDRRYPVVKSHREGYQTLDGEYYFGVEPPTSGDLVPVHYEDNYSNDLIDSRSTYITNNAGVRKRVFPTGGNFEVVKRTYSESSSLPNKPIRLYSRNRPYGYLQLNRPQRAGWPSITNSVFPTPERTSTSELKALGRFAISRTTPTTSEVDLSSTLGEILSEGLPSMIGMSLYGRGSPGNPRGLAEENLNYQFGVKPLISDVTKAVDAFRRSKQIWDRYVANAGKVLKRRYDFPSKVEVTRTTDSSLPAPLGNQSLYEGGFSFPRTIVRTTTRRRWFVGHYRYAIPTDPFERNLSQWNKLYGAIPDVETLWNLAPWSWAADWITDIGTSVSNFSALQADGLVLLGGYMMEYTSTKDEVYLGPVRYASTFSAAGKNPPPSYFTQTFFAERKRRVVASPYGFDVDWDGFSPTQLGILASLGITRGRRP
jgi:hypothetical protein